MKITKMLTMAAMAATLAFAGCSGDGDSSSTSTSSVDTGKLESSFSSAESATKTAVDKVVTAIKSSDYAGALTELKSLAGQANLSPEQQTAIKDLMAQVQKMVSGAAGKAVGDATKAVENLPNPVKP